MFSVAERWYTLIEFFLLDIIVTPFFFTLLFYDSITHNDNREKVFSHYFYHKTMTHMSKEIKYGLKTALRASGGICAVKTLCYFSSFATTAVGVF